MPSLPFDLERLIFEMAALSDTDHDSRGEIMLVAKRVYEWIRPILYRVAIIQELWMPCIGSIVQNWRKAQITDIAPFVRHFLSNIGRQSDILHLLSSFRDVENLAIWDVAISFAHLKRMNDLPLRMLSADMTRIGLNTAIDNCRAFQNLTHFEIIGLKETTWENCEVLIGLPKLTHLCFATSAYLRLKDGVIQNLLKHSTSLQVLLLNIQTINVERIIKLDDPRYLVLWDWVRVENRVEEWERSANGLNGLWKIADVIIKARKDGLFKDQSLFLFSRYTWEKSLNDDGVRWYNEWSRGI